MNLYVDLYNLILSVYGTIETQPDSITNAMYWLPWIIITLFFILIIVLMVFGCFLILRTLRNHKAKKNSNEVHYYYHKWFRL